MNIGDFKIGSAPYLIAEASINHGGSVNTACDMAEAAKEAGCNVVKFQTYITEHFCAPEDPMFSTFKHCELPRDSWKTISDHCKQVGITFLSTPQNVEDLKLLTV